jgi:hypothetical protein
MRVVTAVALGMALGFPHQASGQTSVTGRWSTEFDIGIRNENGVETSMGKRQATMTLELRGDSVFGTWQVAPQGGATPPPVHLKGVRTGTKVQLSAEPVEHTVNMGDGDRTVKMVAVYRLELHDGELVGTSQNTSADGSFDGPERPFSARRIKP